MKSYLSLECDEVGRFNYFLHLVILHNKTNKHIEIIVQCANKVTTALVVLQNFKTQKHKKLYCL